MARTETTLDNILHCLLLTYYVGDKLTSNLLEIQYRSLAFTLINTSVYTKAKLRNKAGLVP